MGVKKYYINSGISTKSDEFGLPPANEWTKVKTNEENENFLVKNTIKHGYFIDAEKKQVLKHPKIEVFIKDTRRYGQVFTIHAVIGKYS